MSKGESVHHLFSGGPRVGTAPRATVPLTMPPRARGQAGTRLHRSYVLQVRRLCAEWSRELPKDGSHQSEDLNPTSEPLHLHLLYCLLRVLTTTPPNVVMTSPEKQALPQPRYRRGDVPQEARKAGHSSENLTLSPSCSAENRSPRSNAQKHM